MTKMTLKDIASRFSVSISTVSKSLHDSHEISESLKAKIRQFAREHHYKPNKVALNLLNRNTKSIGVVFPNILNYFFVQVLYGIEKVANERGYSIISCMSNDSLEKEAKTLDFLSAGSVDGLIISSVASKEEFVKHAERLNDFVERQIPMIMFDRVTDLLDCDKVVVDDYEASYKATKHLLEIGSENILVISPINHTEIGELRIKGYKKALEEREIAFDDKLILPIHDGDDLDFLLSFVLNYKRIDGILALDEVTTVKAMKIVKARGYQVPGDVSIIGFTNGQLSKYVSPALTMVSQHGTYIGETCANLLMDRLESSNEPLPFETKVVKTSLIVRGSTKNPQSIED